MSCSICKRKNCCPDSLYLKGEEYVQSLSRMGVSAYPSGEHGQISVTMPLDGSTEWVGKWVYQRRKAIAHYHRVNWMIARPRYGVSVCLRMLRGSGYHEASNSARGMWRALTEGSGTLGARINSESEAAAVILCRTLNYLSRAQAKPAGKAVA